MILYYHFNSIRNDFLTVTCVLELRGYREFLAILPICPLSGKRGGK